MHNDKVLKSSRNFARKVLSVGSVVVMRMRYKNGDLKKREKKEMAGPAR